MGRRTEVLDNFHVVFPIEIIVICSPTYVLFGSPLQTRIILRRCWLLEFIYYLMKEINTSMINSHVFTERQQRIIGSLHRWRSRRVSKHLRRSAQRHLSVENQFKLSFFRSSPQICRLSPMEIFTQVSVVNCLLNTRIFL